MFIAIGHAPATQLFKGQLEMTHSGYLQTAPEFDRDGRPRRLSPPATSRTRSIRQAVTAAAMGCMAALEAERYFATLEIEAESEAEAAE